jgi:GABA(A) receptor-associated protein
MEAVVQNVKRLFDNGKTYMIRGKSFKEKHPFDKRQDESYRILERYPDRIPVICECVGEGVPDIDRKKYLVPSDITMAQFLYIIRKRIKIKPEQSIYIFVAGSTIVSGSQSMSTIYDGYKDLDGFLYTSYSGENTFG